MAKRFKADGDTPVWHVEGESGETYWTLVEPDYVRTRPLRCLTLGAYVREYGAGVREGSMQIVKDIVRMAAKGK